MQNVCDGLLKGLTRKPFSFILLIFRPIERKMKG